MIEKENQKKTLVFLFQFVSHDIENIFVAWHTWWWCVWLAYGRSVHTVNYAYMFAPTSPAVVDPTRFSVPLELFRMFAAFDVTQMQIDRLSSL